MTDHTPDVEMALMSDAERIRYWRREIDAAGDDVGDEFVWLLAVAEAQERRIAELTESLRQQESQLRTALDELRKPAHEREPPHCSNCSCGLPAEPPSDDRAQNERLRKLFYLSAQDVIFFSTYDEKTDAWPEIGEFWSPCVNLSDTFGYACADGERLDDSQIDCLISAHKQWGYDGVVAWASLIRKSEPIEPRRTPEYFEARVALTTEGGQP